LDPHVDFEAKASSSGEGGVAIHEPAAQDQPAETTIDDLLSDADAASSGKPPWCARLTDAETILEDMEWLAEPLGWVDRSTILHHHQQRRLSV
jgi:hypothetical protein